jgi:hypothetical protein
VDEEVVVAFVFLVGIPAVFGWLLRTWLNHKRFMRVLQLKADANSKLLDRFGTEPAVLDFLKSDASQRLFEVNVSQVIPQAPAPYMRMLTALQASLMLMSVGAGMLYIRHYMDWRDQEGYVIFGTLGVSLGIGAMLSAVAALVVGRLWRTLNEQ